MFGLFGRGCVSSSGNTEAGGVNRQMRSLPGVGGGGGEGGKSTLSASRAMRISYGAEFIWCVFIRGPLFLVKTHQINEGPI